jgi:hypothetical protein
LLDGTFQMNGKPRIEHLSGGNYRYTKAVWENGTLVFDIADKQSKKEDAKILFYLRESWTISPGGAVLTKFRRHTAEGGKIVDQKYVFDKQ